MMRLQKLTPRQVLIVLHDLVGTAAAVVLTFYIRFEDARLYGKLAGLGIFLPGFLIYAAVIYYIFGLHRNKWRFTSVPDLYNIFSRLFGLVAFQRVALDNFVDQHAFKLVNIDSHIGGHST